MVVLAVYNNNALKGVSIKYITPVANQNGSTTETITASDGDEVKGMLWKKNNSRPMADMARILVGK